MPLESELDDLRANRTGPGVMISGTAINHSSRPVSNQELHDLLKSHYTLEESGISIVLLPEPEEDRRANEILKKTSRRSGDRRRVFRQLPNSSEVANVSAEAPKNGS